MKKVKPVKKTKPTVATKKAVAKKAKPTVAKKPVRKPQAPATPPTPPPPPPPPEVTVFINGVNRGRVKTENLSIASFAIQQAQAYGIRTFSVYVDGRKVDVEAGNQDLSTATQVEIVAKDSRG